MLGLVQFHKMKVHLVLCVIIILQEVSFSVILNHFGCNLVNVIFIR